MALLRILYGVLAKTWSHKLILLLSQFNSSEDCGVGIAGHVQVFHLALGSPFLGGGGHKVSCGPEPGM